jgi:hypothetical protein
MTKHGLICRISIRRDLNGMASKDAVASVAGYRRKSVTELKALLAEAYREAPDRPRVVCRTPECDFLCLDGDVCETCKKEGVVA